MLVMEVSGVYECQANTVPKTETTINLHVKDTVAVIAGPREIFLKAGSQLQLHCIVDLGERQGCSGQVRSPLIVRRGDHELWRISPPPSSSLPVPG